MKAAKHKTLTNIIALIVWVVLGLFCGCLYMGISFFLALFAQVNVWISILITGAISMALLIVGTAFLEKIGIKPRFSVKIRRLTNQRDSPKG